MLCHEISNFILIVYYTHCYDNKLDPLLYILRNPNLQISKVNKLVLLNKIRREIRTKILLNSSLRNIHGGKILE